jgi:hypothetical protein
MTSINALSLRITVRSLTLIGLDFPLTTLIDIAKKRKKLLTYTQETSRAKFERIRLVRLIHGDQKTTTRHPMALSRAKRLIRLLAPIKYY